MKKDETRLTCSTHGMKPLGRRRHRRKDNIKIDLKEVRLQAVKCIHLAEDDDRRWGSCEHGNEL
jgi:hypothetical protein